ncbi:MAG: NAD(P)-dependent glycerol-3-phosphate dehydrogenase [Magnetococcales bacterium]|nr:NAD(P)-dependent glycerol-3-phosphate dehydrogenase [Magnetococcales bacterium]
MTENNKSQNAVAIIGAGSWGTALATVLAEKLPAVTLWCREEEVAREIGLHHRNPLYVSELSLPENIHTSTDLLDVVHRHPILVMVVPTQFTRSILHSIREAVGSNTVFISASKGVEVETLTLLSEIYRSVFGSQGSKQSCYLSGPSFARDVIKKLPTAVAIAGVDPILVEKIQHLFHTPTFRTYRTGDVVGLELGGALKNVIAIAAGISDGLGFGHSARAALITRGLTEIMRLGTQLGASAETFSGLSGLGDLLLTATSEMSRNRTVGFRLGSGESLETIQAGSKEVAEGVKTALSIYHLAQRLEIEMPISNAVYEILYENRPPHSVVTDLMNRDLKPENQA